MLSNHIEEFVNYIEKLETSFQFLSKSNMNINIFGFTNIIDLVYESSEVLVLY